MARSVPGIDELDEVPVDPTAIERRYRLERARRRARERHKQESSLARVRFYAVLVVLVAGALSLLVLTWDQVQRLFGL
jgi:hypothetical protein